jgi:hypothetical protein
MVVANMQEHNFNYLMFIQAQHHAGYMNQSMGAFYSLPPASPTAIPPTSMPLASPSNPKTPSTIKTLNPNAKCFTCKGTREVDSPFNPEETVPCRDCK